MNKFIAMGRLTRDPETRIYGDNKTLASFSLAVDRRFKKDGEPTADFFNCTAFGKTAEVIERYIKKGTKVLIEGEIQNNNYKDKNGVKHYSMSVIVNNIEFAESKKAAEGSGTYAAPQTDSDGFMDVPDDGVDELPFA